MTGAEGPLGHPKGLGVIFVMIAGIAAGAGAGIWMVGLPLRHVLGEPRAVLQSDP